MKEKVLLEAGASETRNKLGSLLDCVERGEEVLITRHGKPVARLVPSTGGIDRVQAKAAAERIRARASQLSTGPFGEDDFKTWRNQDRP